MRVLIVDDNDSIRARLRDIIEDLGAEVVAEANEGRRCVESARAHDAELILLDVSMPGMSGFAAARQLHEIIPQVPVILVSQHNNRIYVEEAMSIGVKAFVLKGSAVSDLPAAIPAVMSGGSFVSPSIRLARQPSC